MSPDKTSALIDAHCHFAFQNKTFPIDFPNLLPQHFLVSALTENDLEFYINNKNSSLILSAGIHPSFIDENHISFDKLVTLCDTKTIQAIGEIGLDKRSNQKEEQIYIFKKQLEIARAFKLPVILHCVHSNQELYAQMKEFSELRYIWHGFTGTEEVIKSFSKFNILFSVNQRIFKTKDRINSLNHLVKEGIILFESDMIFIETEGDSSLYNQYFIDLVEQMSELIKTDQEEIIMIQKRNLRIISIFSIF